MRRTLIIAALFVVFTALATITAFGQDVVYYPVAPTTTCPNGTCYAQQPAVQYYVQPQQYQPVYQAQQPAYVPAQYGGGDPYGFVNWLNGVRAQYGLGAVGYDPNLSGWAAMNNQQQSARGIGHFVMGPARRQNSAMAGSDAASVGMMWMGSPAHKAALLDPTITSVGIAAAGAWWTFNAN